MQTRSTFGRQLVFLAVVIAVMYAPTVQYGRLLDDVIVLHKCEKLPWNTLLTEGFRFQRAEVGNVWWIDQPTVMCYFRPLLLATFRAPLMVPGGGDWLQRVLNLGLHFAAAGLLLATCRRILVSPRSAFLATLFFTVCFHPRWTILLITARKELMVAVLVLLALYLHMRGRRGWAGLSLVGALLSGEHAVAFPVIAVLWDLFAPPGRITVAGILATVKRAWPSWAGYLGIVVAYAAIRTAVLDGVPLPAPPYLNRPTDPGFLPYLLLRPIIALFALTTGVPFVDRRIIEIWFNHPVGLIISLAALASIITLLFVAARDRRRCGMFLAFALIAYLPFLPLAAIPFYLYMPFVFYAFAVGVGLDGISLAPPRGNAWYRRVLTGLVSAACAAFFVLGVILSWGPSWPPFSPGAESPQRVADAVGELLENEPLDRKIVFIDAPPPPPFFYFVYELCSSTGRDPEDMTVVTCQHRRIDGAGPAVTVPAPHRILLRSPQRPYFANTVKKLLWCFPDGLIAEGRTFQRDWFSVTIDATTTPGASFGQHFFSQEPGIAALLVEVDPDADPLVIGFDGQEPFVYDLADFSSQPQPAEQ